MSISLPDFSAANILVVGDVMLDRYWHGSTSRVSPEAPVPVVNIQEAQEKPGGAGNVALNTATLGCSTHLFSVVGDDPEAQTLANALSELGVKVHFTQTPARPTITKLRVLSQHQQLIRLDFEQPFHPDCFTTLNGRLDESLNNANMIIISDYGKGVRDIVPDIIQKARKAGIPVIVDPKGSDFSIYHSATIITPNLKEFETIVGPCQTENELVSKGQRLIQDLNLDALLVTRGEKGMTLLCHQDPPFHLTAEAKEVFDVTGAGDTVISVMAAAIAAGESFASASVLANIAAGVVVSRLGAVAVTMPQLRRALRTSYNLGNGQVDEALLLQMVEDAKAHGESIVMTNGCFDILHKGHILYLKQAKQLGDRLIVAVNSDESVRQLKGPQRPINSLDERMEVLASLAVVDWVVPFCEETPQRLIEAVLPDILVKGGDYKAEEIAGADAVINNGGVVKILDFIDGCSTSNMIEKINKA